MLKNIGELSTQSIEKKIRDDRIANFVSNTERFDLRQTRKHIDMINCPGEISTRSLTVSLLTGTFYPPPAHGMRHKNESSSLMDH